MGRRKSSLRSKHSLGSIAEPMDGSSMKKMTITVMRATVSMNQNKM